MASFTWPSMGGGGGGGTTPGGPNLSIQFNGGGAFAGDTGLVYDSTDPANPTLSLGNGATHTILNVNGYTVVSAFSDGTFIGNFGGSVQVGWLFNPAGATLVGFNAPDSCFVGRLGVDNSAAGTALGTLVKKIEIFDKVGVSLGFIPVYDSIT